MSTHKISKNQKNRKHTKSVAPTPITLSRTKDNENNSKYVNIWNNDVPKYYIPVIQILYIVLNAIKLVSMSENL